MPMTLSLADSHALSKSSEFQNRVKISIIRASTDVQSEDPAGLGVPAGFSGTKGELHNLRSQLAHDILHGSLASAFVDVVASDPNDVNITATDDTAIDNAVSAVFSAMAIRGTGV